MDYQFGRPGRRAIYIIEASPEQRLRDRLDLFARLLHHECYPDTYWQRRRSGGTWRIVRRLHNQVEWHRVEIDSTYLGGSEFDMGLGIAADPFGNAYVTGVTESEDIPHRHCHPAHLWRESRRLRDEAE